MFACRLTAIPSTPQTWMLLLSRFRPAQLSVCRHLASVCLAAVSSPSPRRKRSTSSSPSSSTTTPTMDPEVVKERLLEILKKSDLEKVTEKSIKNQLAQELGSPMDAYKDLIKDSIEEYLDFVVAEEEGAQVDTVAVGDKRKAAPAKLQAPPAKAAKEDTGGEYSVELGGSRRASVSVFKGVTRVDLREFYEDRESGEMKATKKGLSLAFDQWLRLKQHLPDLLHALGEGEEGHDVELAHNRKAYISKFKGKCSLHVREMYEQDGQLLPGKVGVTLDASAVTALVQAADALTAAAQKRGAAASSGGAPQQQAKTTTAAAAMQENVRPFAGDKPGGSGGGSGKEFVDLGGDRRASVSNFKGRSGVDLREYYKTPDGSLAPGKKGILLTVQQFTTLASHVSAISSAVSAKDTGFELDLGNKRKVHLSNFKGKVYLGVREFYEDKTSGELKPGQKGLSMTPEHWQKFEAAIPTLQAMLGPVN